MSLITRAGDGKPDLIEETVELELGAEVDQSLVTEGLQRSVSNHGTQQLTTKIQCQCLSVSLVRGKSLTWRSRTKMSSVG